MVRLVRKVTGLAFAHGHGSMDEVESRARVAVAELTSLGAGSALDQVSVVRAVGIVTHGAIDLERGMNELFVGRFDGMTVCAKRGRFGPFLEKMAIALGDVARLALFHIDRSVKERGFFQVAVTFHGQTSGLGIDPFGRLGRPDRWGKDPGDRKSDRTHQTALFFREHNLIAFCRNVRIDTRAPTPGFYSKT